MSDVRRATNELPENVRQFLAQNGCLFQQPWWLDAVCLGPWRWGGVWVERGDQIAAVWPFAFKMRLGLRLIEMPPLTPYLGPVLRPSVAKHANRLAEEKDLLTELIGKLPKSAAFQQQLHPSLTNWLPFYWKGFSQTSHVTYVIPALDDLEGVWSEMQDKVRTDIRKAEKSLQLKEKNGLETFLELNRKTFERQGHAPHIAEDVIRSVDAACTARECRRIFLAHDADGKPHAACYLAWDQHTAYYLMGGADPELRTSGAGSWVIWKAIQFAAALSTRERGAWSVEQKAGSSQPEVAVRDSSSAPSASRSPLTAHRSLSFDFEGSMVEGIERFVRAWGARQISYHAIFKPETFGLKLVRRVAAWAKLFR